MPGNSTDSTGGLKSSRIARPGNLLQPFQQNNLQAAAQGKGLELLGTPSFLWGISVVAAGTSIPDAFVSIRKAQKGDAVTSLANVLGSNIFDLLVCIPAGVLIAGAAVINFTVAAPLMGALTLATLVLFSFMRTNMILGRKESMALIALYLLFLLWMGLENFGVIDSIPSLPG